MTAMQVFNYYLEYLLLRLHDWLPERKNEMNIHIIHFIRSHINKALKLKRSIMLNLVILNIMVKGSYRSNCIIIQSHSCHVQIQLPNLEALFLFLLNIPRHFLATFESLLLRPRLNTLPPSKKPFASTPWWLKLSLNPPLKLPESP